MDISVLNKVAETVDVDNCNCAAVVQKAMELLRLLQIKLPMGSLQKADSSRHIIAIELSCRVLNKNFDRRKLIYHSGMIIKDYRKVLITYKKVLNLTWVVTAAFEILSVKYGIELRKSASKLINDYKANYFDKLSLSEQKYIELDSPLYQSAAFYVLAKKQKVTLFFFVNQ